MSYLEMHSFHNALQKVFKDKYSDEMQFKVTENIL